MQIFDFSNIQSQGFRISRFRLIHSRGLGSARVKELREPYRKSNDLSAEKSLIISRLIEINEIDFTLHYLFAGLMFLFAFMSLASLFFRQHGFLISIISVSATFVLHRISDKFLGDFVMGDVGIRMAEAIYTGLIIENI
jgi:hypothetical protein